MAKYSIIIDVTKCSGCYNCVLACRDEFCGNDYPPYSVSQPMTGQFWMKMIEKERGQYPWVKVAYMAVPCMHCDKATCLDSGKDGAVYKRPDGIIMIDPIKSKGRKDLLSSCPYRSIYWNEDKQLPQKCTMCAHLLDKGWKEPRCVEACPTGALEFGDLRKPDGRIANLFAATEALHPEYRLDEGVRYIGLVRRFIAGSVVFGDTDECAGNVDVNLLGEGEKRTTRTNNYGDFEFDGLPAGKIYSINVESPGYRSQTLEAKTNVDIYLGNIFLARKSPATL